MASHQRHRRRSSFGLAAVIVGLPLAAWALSGCGSGGGTSPAPNGAGLGLSSGVGGTGGTGETSTAFTNRSFQSVVALGEGQTGTLRVTTTASGTASGTFTIDDSARAAATAKSRFVIATPFLSGTFDPQTGTFRLSGSYVDASGHTVVLSISGTFPGPPSYTGGSISTTINGTTYTSTFGVPSATPSPSPSASGSPSPSPSPSPSASPLPSPSPSGTPAPVGPVNTLTFTAEPGTTPNNTFPVFTADPNSTLAVTATGFHAAPITNGGNLSVSAKTNVSTGGGTHSASLTIDLTTPPGGLTTGTFPIQFGTGNTSPTVLFTYLEFNPTHGWQSYKYGVNNDGVFTVEQLDANKVRVRFSNVRLDPAQGGANGEKGSLRVSGILETTAPPFLVN